jgi:membrane associated rhomboid family serine protease
LIPIRDANPSLTRPVITWLVIASAAYVFFAIQPTTEDLFSEFLFEYAAIPCELTTLSPLDSGDVQACNANDVGTPFFPAKNLLASAFISMFLHANLAHLIGNLWSLWIFGNNVEDAYGSGGYVLLYLASGLAATAAFVFTNPGEVTPLVGASGAISGVMGAYLVLFPSARVVSVFPIFFFIPVALPAALFLILWFAGQFALIGGATGIAWQAHVGGFLFGAAVSFLLRGPLLRRVEGHRRKLAGPRSGMQRFG